MTARLRMTHLVCAQISVVSYLGYSRVTRTDSEALVQEVHDIWNK